MAKESFSLENVYQVLVLLTTWLGFESTHGEVKAKDVKASPRTTYCKTPSPRLD